MNPLTVTVWDTVAIILGAFILGHRVGFHRWLWVAVMGVPVWTPADLKSNRVPLPPKRPTLTAPDPLPAGVEGVHIGGRETPAPALLAETRPGPGETPPVRGQDREPCADPCMARHCAHHNAPGTAAQNGGHAHTQAVRAALFTPTAEWPQVVQSLLGLVVPGDLSTLYAGSEAT